MVPPPHIMNSVWMTKAFVPKLTLLHVHLRRIWGGSILKPYFILHFDKASCKTMQSLRLLKCHGLIKQLLKTWLKIFLNYKAYICPDIEYCVPKVIGIYVHVLSKEHWVHTTKSRQTSTWLNPVTLWLKKGNKMWTCILFIAADKEEI